MGIHVGRNVRRKKGKGRSKFNDKENFLRVRGCGGRLNIGDEGAQGYQVGIVEYRVQRDYAYHSRSLWLVFYVFFLQDFTSIERKSMHLYRECIELGKSGYIREYKTVLNSRYWCLCQKGAKQELKSGPLITSVR